MGLFDQIAGALNNPSQQASSNQLGTILSTVQQLSSTYNTDPATTQTMLSTVGTFVRSALQEKRDAGGNDMVQSIVSQFSGSSANSSAIAALFSAPQISQLIETLCARTGLNAQQIQAMLPLLIPVVLNLLQSGASADDPQRGGNPVLNTFLDADNDGDVDIADAIGFAGHFFNQSR
jgi:uncharacterized protein YidB (DUF937 family)